MWKQMIIGNRIMLIIPKGVFVRLQQKYNIPYTVKEMPDCPAEFVVADTAHLTNVQQDYVDRTLPILDGLAHNAIIVQETGGGKTFIAMGIMAKLHQRTLIVIPRHSIEGQWVANIKAWFPNARVATHGGSAKHAALAATADVVIMIVNTAVEKGPQTSGFGLTIFDEIHMYCTPEFNKVFFTAQSHYTVGLTATPKRLDGMDKMLAMHFSTFVGPNPNVVEPITPWQGLCRIVKYSGPLEFTKAYISAVTHTNCVPLLLSQLARDPHRNALIANITTDLAAHGHFVYVMTDRISQLRAVQQLIAGGHPKTPTSGEPQPGPISLSCPELDGTQATNVISLITGGAKADDIKDATHNARVLLTTISYSGTGLSIDRMTALVLATPRRHGMQQILGRIFRHGYKPDVERVVIDIVDMKLSLKSQATDRKKEYKRRDMTIIEEDVSYESIIVVSGACAASDSAEDDEAQVACLEGTTS